MKFSFAIGETTVVWITILAFYSFAAGCTRVPTWMWTLLLAFLALDVWDAWGRCNKP